MGCGSSKQDFVVENNTELKQEVVEVVEETNNNVIQQQEEEHIEHKKELELQEEVTTTTVKEEQEEKGLNSASLPHQIMKEEKEHSVHTNNPQKEHHEEKTHGVNRMLNCYLCGQKYGPTSLPIHLKSCPQQRMNDYKSTLPKELVPTKLANPPSTPMPDQNSNQSEVDKYNDEAYNIFLEYSMIHCPTCNRRFEPDRLVVHLNSCKDKDGNTWFEHNAAKKIQNGYIKFQNKKMLFCYCCGQEYGTKSLPIHLPQCPEKRIAIWKHSGLPDELIKEVPNPPTLSIPNSNDSAEAFKNYNAEARKIYMDSMAQCTGCSRRFEPDRLAVHIRSCKKYKGE
ncbi:hypothetical protein ABK040_002559 [Willaertia magna]